MTPNLQSNLFGRLGNNSNDAIEGLDEVAMAAGECLMERKVDFTKTYHCGFYKLHDVVIDVDLVN